MNFRFGWIRLTISFIISVGLSFLMKSLSICLTNAFCEINIFFITLMVSFVIISFILEVWSREKPIKD